MTPEEKQEYDRQRYQIKRETILEHERQRRSQPGYREWHRGYMREWSKNNKDKIRKYNSNDYSREARLAAGKKYREKFRTLVLDYYGNKCACCGEDRIEFLAIDHIEGGGSKHRKELGNKGGTAFYVWLVKNNFPEGYRTLCHNCNMALAYHELCPHQRHETFEYGLGI